MSHASDKTGVCLINLGTPKSPEPGDVRVYLREFLSDPRVIDINPVGRWALLNFAILPFRPKQSGEAYAKVWTERGSPLLFHSEDLRDRVAEKLGDRYEVVLAMRYGEPSIPAAIEKLAHFERIVVLPLFPQYSSAATGSALERFLELMAQRWNVPNIDTVPPFFDHPSFIDAFVQVSQPVLDEFGADYVLFSYHGLPERHMLKSDPTGSHCLASESCCDAMVEANRYCYRAQCFATTRALVDRLSLSAEGHGVSFQSRLGRTPWIKPYTDVVLDELAAAGKKRLAVFSPAFVADCLETLEELEMRAKEQFIEAGGEDLKLIPSLNAHPRWVDAVCELVRDHDSASNSI
ncbi:MAG: ferrochelatase [Deltaproteobacteria bacterium]